ncbi:hypothetical protein B1F79_00145 [Coxiella-like endosymbiont of Rhipicephalus sanguineus]|nr:hypothetical protein [Coxiella-like endosymbiont of Rhipicephalus sanguineus]
MAINPLVDACAPLLTIATQLRVQNHRPNFNKLHFQLSDDIRVFEAKIHSRAYHSHIVLAARYFICVLIDEIILQTSWGKDSGWRQIGLLKTFQGEMWDGERFFFILKRSTEELALHLDLLELGYLCLSLGYQGKYGEKPDGYRDFSRFF